MFINLTNYPTKEKILRHLPKIKKEVILTLKNFKKDLWRKNDSTEEKFRHLSALIYVLDSIYYKPTTNVSFIPDALSYSYDPFTNTIVINKSSSIISTLHEYGHKLFGPSETKACRWSVSLFKKIYPKAFAKLKWQRHMLVRE